MVLKVATVCTGVGAPEQAIRELGWKHEISFGCEIDKYARATYQANFDPHRMFTDMTAESWIGEEYESDLFVGGIPCQAFSLAGKRMGELDPRGLLFYNFYDYVKKQRPKVFLIENVKGLLSDDNGRTFQNWLQLLGNSVNTQPVMFPHPDSLGYNLHWTVLNAKDFGLPQNRERVFIVGIRNDLPNTFRFPVGWPLELRLKDVLETHVAEKYYLSDKLVSQFVGKKSTSNDVIIDGEVVPNSQSNKVYNENGISPTIISGTHGYAIGYIIQSKLIPFGNSQDQKLSPLNGISQTLSAGHFNQPKVMVEEPVLFSNSGLSRKRKIEKICPPLRSHDGCCSDNLVLSCDLVKVDFEHGEDGVQYYVNNKGKLFYYKKRIRRLTPRECFRLQGFPDSFDISQVSETQAYKQAGNSIPVTVLKEIFKNLKPVIS